TARVPPPARTSAIRSFLSASGSWIRLAISGTSVSSFMEQLPFFMRFDFAPPRFCAWKGRPRAAGCSLGRNFSRTTGSLRPPKKNNSESCLPSYQKQFTQKMSQRRNLGYKPRRNLQATAPALDLTNKGRTAFRSEWNHDWLPTVEVSFRRR